VLLFPAAAIFLAIPVIFRGRHDVTQLDVFALDDVCSSKFLRVGGRALLRLDR